MESSLTEHQDVRKTSVNSESTRDGCTEDGKLPLFQNEAYGMSKTTKNFTVETVYIIPKPLEAYPCSQNVGVF